MKYFKNALTFYKRDVIVIKTLELLSQFTKLNQR